MAFVDWIIMNIEFVLGFLTGFASFALIWVIFLWNFKNKHARVAVSKKIIKCNDGNYREGKS